MFVYYIGRRAVAIERWRKNGVGGFKLIKKWAELEKDHVIWITE